MRADWGCAGAHAGAAQGRRLGLCRSADLGCAGAQTGAAHGRRLGLRRGADWGCAGAQTGAAQGRRLGLRRGADWGSAGAQTGAAQGRRLGMRMGADWGCAGAQTGAAQEGGGGASPQAFGDPPRRRAPHQEVIGARASVCARAPIRRLGLCRSADWGCAGAQTGAAHGRRLGLRMSADWGCAGAQSGAAHGRRLGLRRSADWGCAGAQTGAAQGRRLGLRMRAGWGCAGAQTGAVQGHRLGLRRRGGGGASPQAFGDPPRRRAPHQEVIGARASVCARAPIRRLGLCRSADWGCAGAQTGAAHGRRLGLRMGADWGCAGAQSGAAHGRRLGLRRSADWGCAGPQTGAAQGRRLGLCRGTDWGCAGGGGGGRLTIGFWRPPQAPGSSPGGYWGPGQRAREGLTTGFWPRAVGGGAPGGRSGWFPPGLAQLCMATGQQRLFLTGLMSVHGPGRMGEGPNSRPRRFLLAVPGGGGGACGFVCFGRRATSHGKTQAASSRWGTSAGLGGGGWHKALVVGSVSLWRCLLASRL